jgi:hypothetical protein
MDKTLAEFYGTNADVEVDAEKLAAAEAAEVLAGEKGVNLEDGEMTEEDLEAVAEEVLKGEGGETPTEETEVKEPEAAAQEKFAEADYMGRVMAHAFVAESKEIEKEATAKAKTASKAGKVADHLKKVKKSAAMPPQFMKGKEEKGKEGKEEKEEKKEKKSSAFEQLVNTRIAEILQANDIDPTTVKVSEADPKAVLAAKVDEKAYETLKEMGFQIEE